MILLEVFQDTVSMLVACIVFYAEKLQFVRRWRGGRWELWWIGPPFHSSIWCQMNEGDECPPLGLLCEAVEDYRPKPPLLPASSPYRTIGVRDQQGEKR